MKKNLLLLIPALALVFFVASCSKDDTPPPANTTEGKWNGTYTLNGGSQLCFYSINFKTSGALDIIGEQSTPLDNGTGSYTVAGDSVKGLFTYTVGIGIIYNFAGKYSSGNSVITGTIGISPSYTDNATFSITK
ncbi:MAG: hypothetical protein IPO42_02930 [Chitinophagaceae bacterium]|nr:hypothetical protein [Chitinophagaceae bacterium]